MQDEIPQEIINHLSAMMNLAMVKFNEGLETVRGNLPYNEKLVRVIACLDESIILVEDVRSYLNAGHYKEQADQALQMLLETRKQFDK